MEPDQVSAAVFAGAFALAFYFFVVGFQAHEGFVYSALWPLRVAWRLVKLPWRVCAALGRAFDAPEPTPAWRRFNVGDKVKRVGSSADFDGEVCENKCQPGTVRVRWLDRKTNVLSLSLELEEALELQDDASGPIQEAADRLQKARERNAAKAKTKLTASERVSPSPLERLMGDRDTSAEPYDSARDRVDDVHQAPDGTIVMQLWREGETRYWFVPECQSLMIDASGKHQLIPRGDEPNWLGKKLTFAQPKKVRFFWQEHIFTDGKPFNGFLTDELEDPSFTAAEDLEELGNVATEKIAYGSKPDPMKAPATKADILALSSEMNCLIKRELQVKCLNEIFDKMTDAQITVSNEPTFDGVTTTITIKGEIDTRKL